MLMSFVSELLVTTGSPLQRVFSFKGLCTEVHHAATDTQCV